MKRLIILVAVVMLCAGMASAELQYGVKMGMSIGNMAIDPEFDEWGPSGADDVMKLGFYGGVWVKHMFNEKMGILSGLNYIQKGDKYTYEDGSYDAKVIFYGNNLEVPVLFYYMATDKMALYAGPVLAYVLKGGYIESATYDEDNITEFGGIELGDYVNRFEFSMGAGVKYDISEKYFLELGYEYGLTDMVDLDDSFSGDVDSMKTSTFTFGFGYAL